MFDKIKDYLIGRIDEFSTWIAIILLVIAVLALPKGLTAFLIVALAIIIILVPDTKFSKWVRKLFL